MVGSHRITLALQLSTLKAVSAAGYICYSHRYHHEQYSDSIKYENFDKLHVRSCAFIEHTTKVISRTLRPHIILRTSEITSQEHHEHLFLNNPAHWDPLTNIVCEHYLHYTCSQTSGISGYLFIPLATTCLKNIVNITRNLATIVREYYLHYTCSRTALGISRISCYLFIGRYCMFRRSQLPSCHVELYVSINRASQRYKWPSWLIFDVNFRQEMAETGNKDWATLDPSMYADCFNGQAKNPTGWCTYCHSLDHSEENCPLQPPPCKTAPTGSNQQTSQRLPTSQTT